MSEYDTSIPRELSDAELSAIYREAFGLDDSRLVGADLKLARAISKASAERARAALSVSAAAAGEREQFEAFQAFRRCRGAARRETMFERLPDDTYRDESVQRHWWTWQNARAAIQPPGAVAAEPDVEQLSEMVQSLDKRCAELEAENAALRAPTPAAVAQPSAEK